MVDNEPLTISEKFEMLLNASERLLECHKAVRMDAPEQQELHQRVCDTFENALTTIAGWPTAEEPSKDPVQT